MYLVYKLNSERFSNKTYTDFPSAEKAAERDKGIVIAVSEIARFWGTSNALPSRYEPRPSLALSECVTHLKGALRNVTQFKTTKRFNDPGAQAANSIISTLEELISFTSQVEKKEKTLNKPPEKKSSSTTTVRRFLEID